MWLGHYLRTCTSPPSPRTTTHVPDAVSPIAAVQVRRVEVYAGTLAVPLLRPVWSWLQGGSPSRLALLVSV